MATLRSRINQLEQALQDLSLTKCPLCLDGGVWRMCINGQSQIKQNDPFYDEVWHCRQCGTTSLHTNHSLRQKVLVR
jgi:hypothetical protein